MRDFWTWADAHAWCASWLIFWAGLAVWSFLMKLMGIVDWLVITRRGRSPAQPTTATPRKGLSR